jgi:Mrp family chromosome partitioning ATPase
MLGFESRGAKAAALRRFEDDIEMLRLGLIAAMQGGGGQVTSLLGQSRGAGTTTLAIWLARALARASRPTVLVDGNVVNPVLHERFGTASEPGLVDLLDRRAEPDAVLRPTSVPNLSVVPCGAPEAPAISTSAAEWRDRWRPLASDRTFLIDAGSIDSPSALAMADASDGVILVVKCGTARREQIESIQRRMSLSGTRLVGVVLNHRRYVVPEVVYRRL